MAPIGEQRVLMSAVTCMPKSNGFNPEHDYCGESWFNKNSHCNNVTKFVYSYVRRVCEDEHGLSITFYGIS